MVLYQKTIGNIGVALFLIAYFCLFLTVGILAYKATKCDPTDSSVTK
jgi:hypothetical protein